MKLCEMLRDKGWVDSFLEVSRLRLQCNARILMRTLDEFNISYSTPRGKPYSSSAFSIFRLKGIQQLKMSI